MSKYPGEIRTHLNGEDAKLLMEIVRERKSTRTRIIRLALDVYKQLSDNARNENDEVVVLRDRDPHYWIALPWHDDWDGLPEEVEERAIQATHGDVDLYYAAEGGAVGPRPGAPEQEQRRT